MMTRCTPHAPCPTPTLCGLEGGCHVAEAAGPAAPTPLQTAARLVAEATPEQLPAALDALRDHLASQPLAPFSRRQENGPAPAAEPVRWIDVLLLVNEYASHVADAANHEAASRADIAKSAALRTLGKLRAIYAAGGGLR